MSEFTKDRISVTFKFKQSESYANDGAWIVLESNSAEVLKQQVSEVTGIDTTGLSLMDAVSNAQQALLGLQNASQTLGGTVVPSEPVSAPTPAKKARPKPKQAAAPAPESATVSEGQSDILSAIAACDSKDELTALWRERKAEVVGDVRDAFKARGEEVENG